MTNRYLVLLLLVCVAAWPSSAQQTQTTIDTAAPLLTLDEAVSLATANNRLVKNSILEAEKHNFRIDTARSRRLPRFQFAVLGGELLKPFDFTFRRGTFGTYPATGPIPATDTKVRNAAQFATHVTGAIDQPLTQQYKIGLGVRATELGRDIAQEDVRAERLKIVASVRNAYFNLVATQAGLDAAREAVATLEEANRITTEYQLQQTVLRGEALEVDARLAKARYELSMAEDGLATGREHLNQLLGRELSTPFRVDQMPEDDETDLTLDRARRQAAQNRPEIRQANLKEKLAEYDRRIAKAEYIPDLSVSVRYIGLRNVEVLPENVAMAGFFLSWEPFDWGRRRNAVSEKAKSLEQARNGTQEAESQVAVEVGMKYRKWRESALLLKATRITHQAAVEQFRVTGNRYREQAALVKDLLQAQTRTTEAGFEYQRALSSYWSALAELRRAMGEE